MDVEQVRWAHVVLDLPAGAEAEVDFWATALGYRLGEPWPGHPELRSLEPPEGDAYVHLQAVTGPPRVHLDLDVADVPAAARRLQDLGASFVRETEDWTTLLSPGGLPVCLVPAQPRRRPPALRWPSGSTSRLVQVCLDCPPDQAETEARFWAAATGWAWQPSDSPEFVCHLVPATGSLQLLVQRRGPDEPADAPVTAHLDLGADDREAEASRLMALGAAREWTGGGWITLRDPAGLLFCATGQPPEAP
jgi:hypothetical protein